MPFPKREADRTVYSTAAGRCCAECGKPVANCSCKKKTAASVGDGVVRVRREVKGRAGKTVTTIAGVPLAEAELRELAAQLKRSCGTGGSVKEGVIEIQGDHGERLMQALRELGYVVKKSGG